VESTGTASPIGPAPELAGQEEEQFEWGEVIRGRQHPYRFIQKVTFRHIGFSDIQTWLTGMAYCGLVVSLYSYSLFLWVLLCFFSIDIGVLRFCISPTIVAGLGYSGGAAQLHTGCIFEFLTSLFHSSLIFIVPPYVPAVVLTGFYRLLSYSFHRFHTHTTTVIVAILSDRLKWRGPFILICLPLTIIGEDHVLFLHGTCLYDKHMARLYNRNNSDDKRYKIHCGVFYGGRRVSQTATSLNTFLTDSFTGTRQAHAFCAFPRH
jgi:hypothetical protein